MHVYCLVTFSDYMLDRENVTFPFSFFPLYLTEKTQYIKSVLIYIQQDATLHILFYLETALHVSDGTITPHQQRKQLYLQYLVFVTGGFLVWWRTPPTAHSNWFHLFHVSGR
jgi:hypothetical protein